MVKSMIMTSADGVLHVYGEMCGCAVNALALDFVFPLCGFSLSLFCNYTRTRWI